MGIQEQVHEKFKVFVGSSVDELNDQISAFTTGGHVAAKSIGVEYLESAGKLVLSLGYQDGNGYRSHLTWQSVGAFDPGSSASCDQLADALTKAAGSAGNVICHELFVTGSGEATAVFLAYS